MLEPKSWITVEGLGLLSPCDSGLGDFRRSIHCLGASRSTGVRFTRLARCSQMAAVLRFWSGVSKRDHTANVKLQNLHVSTDRFRNNCKFSLPSGCKSGKNHRHRGRQYQAKIMPNLHVWGNETKKKNGRIATWDSIHPTTLTCNFQPRVWGGPTVSSG